MIFMDQILLCYAMGPPCLPFCLLPFPLPYSRQTVIIHPPTHANISQSLSFASTPITHLDFSSKIQIEKNKKQKIKRERGVSFCPLSEAIKKPKEEGKKKEQKCKKIPKSVSNSHNLRSFGLSREKFHAPFSFSPSPSIGSVILFCLRKRGDKTKQKLIIVSSLLKITLPTKYLIRINLNI